MHEARAYGFIREGGNTIEYVHPLLSSAAGGGTGGPPAVPDHQPHRPPVICTHPARPRGREVGPGDGWTWACMGCTAACEGRHNACHAVARQYVRITLEVPYVAFVARLQV